MVVQPKLVRLANPSTIQAQFKENKKFFPYFKDCLGALDGTHILAQVAKEMVAAFRNRKQSVSQNVLGVCDFHSKFTYILSGWEGSAHDGRILADAFAKGLILPSGKYYLGDAGFSLSMNVLTPYRGVRYHLQEFAKSKSAPQNPKELFNLRHSSFRNCIERAFGILKRRFAIFQIHPEYPFHVQAKIALVLPAIHNFIMEHKADSDEIYNDTDDMQDDLDNRQEHEDDSRQAVNANASQFRDEIAMQMWLNRNE